MIKVVEAISDSNIGGAGIVLLNRLRCIDKSKFSTTVILPRRSMLRKPLEEMGIKILEIGKGERSFSLLDLPALFLTVRKLSPDIINSHAWLTSRIAATLAGVKSRVYTRHCSFPVPRIYRHRTVCLLNRAFFSLTSDKAIAVAKVVKEDLVSMGLRPEDISLVVNGACPVRMLKKEEKDQLKKDLKIPQKARIVSIFARLEVYKDHRTFLNAAKILSDTDKRYRFLVVGGGSLLGALKKYAEKLGISHFVRFTGFVEDVAPYMNVTDINVNCSVGTETSSLSLSEGMSLGIPAVASDYGGNPYMVRNGENGYLFEAGNAKALAEKILQLEDSTLYKRLSLGAKARFDSELNAKAMAKKTEQIYKELFSGKACRNY